MPKMVPPRFSLKRLFRSRRLLGVAPEADQTKIPGNTRTIPHARALRRELNLLRHYSERDRIINTCDRPPERQHHLVNRGRADAKKFLHVGFGRGLAVQTRVEVDKRQILALLGREVFCRVTHAGHPIQLFVRASHEEEAWMNVRYRVELSQTERSELTALLSGGKQAARKLKRAQILLTADAGVSDDDIATSVGVGGSTVYRTKQRFVFDNLEAALSEAPRPGASRKLSGKEEALAGCDGLFQATGGPRPLDPGTIGG